MALRSGVQAVDGVGGDLYGGREPERHVGADDVVVDRLRHSDDRQTEVVVQLAGDGQRTVATDDDEAIDAHVTKRRGDLLRAVDVVVRTTPPGAQQCAALGQHAAQRTNVERHGAPLAHTVPCIEEADQLVAIVELALSDDRPDDRVESWAIPATCQNADAHVCTG